MHTPQAMRQPLQILASGLDQLGKTTPNWKVARTIYLNANHEIQKIQEDNSKSANQKKQEISDKTLAMNSDLMAFANTRKKDARL